jgi:WhiB family redox-sensing transcriptional regulator
MRRPAWWAGATCRSAPPAVDFFPSTGEDCRPAKAVCAGCEVCAACGTWAAIQGQGLVGVWGGLTRQERRSKARGARCPDDCPAGAWRALRPL